MTNHQHPIQTVTAYVLTEWAMMLIEPAAAAPRQVFAAEAPFHRVSAIYRGVFDGKLSVICQEGFLEMLAQNVLGLDADEAVDPRDREDALREFANIISGNFLVEAYGRETVFDLPSFECEHGDYATVQPFFESRDSKYLRDASAFYLADGQPLYICFDIFASEY
jgi:hypothetical protein